MMCETSCLHCERPQNYKVNYSRYHGICEVHASFSEPTTICRMCNSTISILKLFPLRNCDFCGKVKEFIKIECGHWICKDCCSVTECQECLNMEDISAGHSTRTAEFVDNSHQSFQSLKKSRDILQRLEETNSLDQQCVNTMELLSLEQILCQYCLVCTSSIRRPCSHALCKQCNQSECLICKITNDPNTDLKEMKQCENCLGSEIAVDRPCKHIICDGCFGECCPICTLMNRESVLLEVKANPTIVDEIGNANDINSEVEDSSEFTFHDSDSSEKNKEVLIENPPEGRQLEEECSRKSEPGLQCADIIAYCTNNVSYLEEAKLYLREEKGGNNSEEKINESKEEAEKIEMGTKIIVLNTEESEREYTHITSCKKGSKTQDAIANKHCQCIVS